MKPNFESRPVALNSGVFCIRYSNIIDSCIFSYQIKCLMQLIPSHSRKHQPAKFYAFSIVPFDIRQKNSSKRKTLVNNWKRKTRLRNRFRLKGRLETKGTRNVGATQKINCFRERKTFYETKFDYFFSIHYVSHDFPLGMEKKFPFMIRFFIDIQCKDPLNTDKLIVQSVESFENRQRFSC